MSLLLATKHVQRRLLKTEKSAFPRIQPRCRYVGTCGGCNLQDLAYGHQLALKQRLLEQAFRPFDVATIPLEPLHDPWRYRNKIELSFGRARETMALGLHALGSFWKVVDLEDCWLVPEPCAAVWATVREAARRSGLPAYDVKHHEGFWRYAVLRYSRHTGELLVCVMTADGPRDGVDQVAAAVRAAHPQVATCYWGITRRLADVAAPDELHLLYGPPYLREQIGPFLMDLHPMNFVQPSLGQAERIYETISAWVRERQLASAWDLYAGLGCIGFYLARVVPSVACLESDPHNVALLRRNAALNQLANLTAQQGHVESHLRSASELSRPGCIVVDPPRAGLHKYALRAITQHQPQCFVYLSCNLATLIPDLHALLQRWPTYRLTAVRAFDMFPQTTHVETLVLLERP